MKFSRRLMTTLMTAGLHLVSPAPASAQNPAGPPPDWPINEDESKVPPCPLPELLKCQDGRSVETADDWRWHRRPELLTLFRDGMFGRAPELPPVTAEVLEPPAPAFGGKALRKQVRVFLSGRKEGPAMDILLYVPAGLTRPVPFFWGLNFQGNHTVAEDPGILLPRPPRDGPVPRPQARREYARGAQAERWQIEKVISRGFGTATAWYEDIDPDYDDGFKNGVHALYPEMESVRDGHTWGSLAAWAWALRAGMSWLETEPWCDSGKVALHGHSRLGKAALWAGAQDERFDIVISNNSGCGGAALSKRWFGETVGRINTSFPHWFCGDWKQWNGREAEMPFDQHQLLALIAPRGLLVGSAEEDAWADPEGELQAVKAASPAFTLLGQSGLDPALKRENLVRTAGNPAYWQRPGKHDVLESDWVRWMEFARSRWNLP